MSENALTVVEPAELTTERQPINPAVAYLAGLPSQNSQRAMQNALNMIADTIHQGRLDKADKRRFRAINWGGLRSVHTDAIRAELIKQGRAPTTVNHALSALRGVLNKACDMGMMTDDECRKACKLPPIKNTAPLAGHHIVDKEILALSRACQRDKSPAGARDLAIIGIEATEPIRRAEVVTIDLEHYDRETGKITIFGKGRKSRSIYVKNGAKAALDAWIAVRGSEPGPLFMPVNKGGKLVRQRMTTQAIYNIMVKRGEQAGVKKFSPHDFRRTVIGNLLSAGVDIAIVARMAGHASVTTTARYDRRPETEQENAAALLHFPF